MRNRNIFKLIVVSVIVILSFNTTKAQDGAALFKNNCAACHKLEGTLVGPGLKGVKAKWAEAGEEANLLLWVKNSEELYNGGKSELAKLAWEISPIAMAPQALSDEEITAIFEFVEADVVEKPKGETDGSSQLIEKPGRKPGEPLTEYKMPEKEAKILKKKSENTRRMIFFLLVVTAFCLVLGIVSISKTIETFAVLKIRKKDKENNSKSIATVILVLIMLSPFSGYSMSFDFEKDGWLLISNLDNLLLFAVNLVLLFIVFDQKKTLKTIIENYDASILKKKKVVAEEEKDASETVMNLLTDTVAIEDEGSILMDHEYDGIRELDNNLPPWWVWSFAASIVAAFMYLMHFHVLGTGDLQIAEYNKDIAAEQLKVDEYMSAMSMNVDENNVVVLTEASDIEAGKGLYKLNCVVCHKDNGEGLVGPNLTDDYWIVGNDIKSVFTTVKYGTTNGMPEHESKLNPIELQQVASYILTMEYVEGKAPEGTEMIE
ncbi:MAG: c-type cytochrome [Flavobacteriales bacterium]|nr:c-type cytochrome [Flavobacteriales bacterium]